jgi:flagellar basal body P-ring formation protein FlgA
MRLVFKFIHPMNPVMARGLTGLMLICLLSGTASAQTTWESHSRIVLSATEYLESLPPVDPHQTRVEINPAQLDTRLKLPLCRVPLESNLTGDQKPLGRVIVEVSCEDEKPWKVRLPVQVSVFAPIAVTSKPIARNQQISRSDIFLEDRDISKLNRGYYSKISDVTGLVTRIQIRSGIVVNPGQVRAPRLVQRGQTVKIVVKTPSYEVGMQGKALSNGALGEVIRVKNSKSQRVVEGVVTAQGIVEISHH